MPGNRVCEACGALVTDGANFCGACGHVTPETAVTAPQAPVAPRVPSPSPPAPAPLPAALSAVAPTGGPPSWVLPSALGAVAFAVVALIVVLLAGGSGDDGASSTSSTSASAPTVTASPASVPPTTAPPVTVPGPNNTPAAAVIAQLESTGDIYGGDCAAVGVSPDYFCTNSVNQQGDQYVYEMWSDPFVRAVTVAVQDGMWVVVDVYYP